MITVVHNLDPTKFMWLWSKYVRGVNDQQHCTHSIRGWYSKKLTKQNPKLTEERCIILDERDEASFEAVYICGVARAGYAKKTNYPHNLHAVVLPKKGKKDSFEFEDWRLEVDGGVFDPIPTLEELPSKYLRYADEFTTCRIFRWAVVRGSRLFES